MGLTVTDFDGDAVKLSRGATGRELVLLRTVHSGRSGVPVYLDVAAIPQVIAYLADALADHAKQLGENEARSCEHCGDEHTQCDMCGHETVQRTCPACGSLTCEIEAMAVGDAREARGLPRQEETNV